MDGSLPKQTLLQPDNLTGQEVHPDLHMVESRNRLPHQTLPHSLQDQSMKSVTNGQPLCTWFPDQGTSGAESMETWGTAQLYHFIQRAAQQDEILHLELQQMRAATTTD